MKMFSKQSYFFSREKKGKILMDNIVFIFLTLIFLSSLVLFVSKQSSSSRVLNSIYAKKIALLIDASVPGERIILNVNDLWKASEAEKIPLKDVIKINGNEVFVKSSRDSSSSYFFFNDVKVFAYPDTNSASALNGNYVFLIEGKKNG